MQRTGASCADGTRGALCVAEGDVHLSGARRIAEMALRLEAWLGEENGGKADLWLAQQSAYDLWQARAKGVPKVARVQARA